MIAHDTTEKPSKTMRTASTAGPASESMKKIPTLESGISINGL
jgi:hypothetical protein